MKKKPLKRKQTRSTSFPRSFLWIGGLFLVGALGLIIFASLASPSSGGRPVETAAVIQTGALVYQQQCAACHGANLEGQPDWQQPLPNGLFKAPPHDETGHTWHHDDEYLIERTRTGAAALPADMQPLSTMPAYGDILTEEEITAVISYIKSTWPADIREVQSGR